MTTGNKFGERGKVFLARVNRSEEVPGIHTVTLDLIQDKDAVEILDGDEFVTVLLNVDPFKTSGESPS